MQTYWQIQREVVVGLKVIKASSDITLYCIIQICDDKQHQGIYIVLIIIRNTNNIFNSQPMHEMSYSFGNTFGRSERTENSNQFGQCLSIQSKSLKQLIRQSNEANKKSGLEKQFKEIDHLNNKMVNLIGELNVFNKENRAPIFQSSQKNKNKTNPLQPISRNVSKENMSSLKGKIKTIQSEFTLTEADQESIIYGKFQRNRSKTEQQQNKQSIISEKIKLISKKIDNYQSKVYQSFDKKSDWFVNSNPDSQKKNKSHMTSKNHRTSHKSIAKSKDPQQKFMFYQQENPLQTIRVVNQHINFNNSKNKTIKNSKISIQQKISAKLSTKIPKAASLFITQIALDEELRKAKKQFSKIFQEQKWVLLSYKLRQNGINIPYEYIEEIFIAKNDESDPFYSVTVQSHEQIKAIVENLVRSFIESEQHYEKFLKNRLNRYELNCLQINQHIKGQGMRLDEFTIFLNSITKCIFMCRDTTLLYNRLKGNSHELTKKNFCKNLISKNI